MPADRVAPRAACHDPRRGEVWRRPDRPICVDDVDADHYGAPRKPAGALVGVVAVGGGARVSHAGAEVARRAERRGRRGRAVDAAHPHGIVAPRPVVVDAPGDGPASPGGVGLLRPPAEHEREAGGVAAPLPEMPGRSKPTATRDRPARRPARRGGAA
jgi:hypothetical protein